MPMTITATERIIRRVLLQVAGEQHMDLTVPQVQLLAASAARAVDARTNARAVEAGLARPPAPPAGPGASSVPPPTPSAREKALQRLRADPLAVAAVRLVAEHMTNPEIAEHLGVSLDQIRYRLREWFAAAERTSRTGLAAWAKRDGLLDAEPGVPATAPGGPSGSPSTAPGSTETSARPSAPQAATQAVRA